MFNNTALDDLRHYAKDAKPQAATGGFQEPYFIQKALESAADAIEELQARVKPDGPAERRNAHAALLGGACEVQRFPGFEEVADLMHFHVGA